jgi:hypothetical protein
LVKWDGLLSGLRICAHCRETMKVRLSSDIGVVIHWVGDVYFFDVVLVVEGYNLSYVLYREVYGFK